MEGGLFGRRDGIQGVSIFGDANGPTITIPLVASRDTAFEVCGWLELKHHFI